MTQVTATHPLQQQQRQQQASAAGQAGANEEVVRWRLLSLRCLPGMLAPDTAVLQLAVH
jgi:hypothetical protein